MKRQVSLSEVLDAAIDGRMLDVHTVMVGRVEQVNLTTRKVDVRPAMRRVLQGPDGELSTELLPILPQVPLGALRAGSARIEVPVQQGHWVVVMFFEDNVGKWLAQGGVGVSPGDVERHGLTGAVAVPLLYPDTEKPAEPLDPLNVVIRSGSGSVLLGGTAGHDFVALAAKVDAEVAKLNAAITTLKGASSSAITAIAAKLVPADTLIGPAFTTATAAVPATAVTVAATKVKAT